MDIEGARTQLNTQLKKMLTTESFIGRQEISRVLLINCFWAATIIDLPNDEELQGQLLSLLKAWRPGAENRYDADDYEL